MGSEIPLYDFIVVGAGPAGCVLASRLANSKKRPLVLLVEAGGDNSDVGQRIAANKYAQWLNPPQAWGYMSSAQENLAGRELNMARGKGLGGSSGVNFSAWTVGPRDDMDEMARRTGDDAWSWERARDRWRSLENYHALPRGGEEPHRNPGQRLPAYADKYLKPNPAVHGIGGPLHIAFSEIWDAEATDMADAWAASGYDLNPDMADDAFLGVSMVPSTEYRGVRVTAADLLYPTPDNLHILTDAPVHRVLIENGKAVGIKLLGEDGRESRAAKEVVLSAGAMDTPKVLMHSGVGPAAELRRFDLPVVRDAPGVGQNYRDHYHVILSFERKKDATQRPAFYRDPTRQQAARREWELFRTGEYATLGTQLSMGFFKSTAVLESPEFAALPPAERERLSAPTVPSYEVCFNVAAADYILAPETAPPIAVIFVFVMNSQGKGQFSLQSADPAVPLRFGPDYLRDPYDRRVVVEATREVLAVTETEPFQSKTVRPIAVPASTSDEDILKFWTENCSCTWHMCGTVMMGREDEGACVDTDFRVYGVQSLRVVDMSIMPFMPSTHTQTTAYQIGMIAAEKLTKEYGLDA